MRFRSFAAVTTCAGFGALLAVGSLHAGAAALQAPRDPAWVEARVRELQPTAAERRFDEIGWSRDIRAAIRLAGRHRRPVFLFTHDGAMATGRC